ncbi:hypothetical protein PHYPO_G00105250 [Pangasianodon hypophthalmus]|uniref:Uncharacterized protein n=1 Tax=Pangasianodon hypophthalmus TaxID=310915 RepID=A0A5N5PXA7_PANHP|nr:hypothetical protein PHYPO_G00105250 [Pangasianodon hypophthalmus]
MCTTTEAHIGFYSCQPRTGIWDDSGHRLFKTRQLKMFFQTSKPSSLSHGLAFCLAPSHQDSLNTHKELLRAPEQSQTHTNAALDYTVSVDGGIRLTVRCMKACGWQEMMTQVQ